MLTVVATPFQTGSADELRRNIAYARFATADALRRGESPIAAHLMYPQIWASAPGLKPATQRAITHMVRFVEVVTLYTDLGTDLEMAQTRNKAELFQCQVEERNLFVDKSTAEVHELLMAERLHTLADLVESIQLAERLTGS
jgi:hypothetical protein